jgi:hypothetical protein
VGGGGEGSDAEEHMTHNALVHTQEGAEAAAEDHGYIVREHMLNVARQYMDAKRIHQ